MATKSRSESVTLCGLEVRDPWGQSMFRAYVGDVCGEWRTHRRTAKMDLDRMMRTTEHLVPWGFGPVRIVD